ncbi:Ig-like domain-containing protein [Lentilactobacillus otakiensis]|uniref:Ig-like domain-containing protein n=1 Tax=Lentilactobacillus otakiensis TaxID=481720 RepID=UPI00293C2AE6|nr:Ig-like domain-containing protein [Lentilactobacillus otakiensis]MDV3518481.1 Ig-like domain-containing protein [Lentilactobacillus otakiensis]
MKKTILMSVGLSALLLSSPVLAKSSHVSLNVNPVTGNQTNVSGETTKLATIKVLHNKTLLGKGTASKKGAFKITLKVPIKNGWKYTIQATKRDLAAKKYTVTALYASTKTDQAQSNNYQDEIHDLQNTIVSLQSQLNDLKNKTQQATTTIITEPSNNTDNSSNNSDSNDSNPAPTANQKKIEDLQDQIQAMYKQITTISQNMDQVRTSINKNDPNLNSDIPSSEKLDEYNNGKSLDSLDKDLSYWNSLATDANKKLNQLSPNDNEYYVVNSELNKYNDFIKGVNEEISYYNSMTKAITDAGGQAGYLKKAKNYSDQYNSLNSQLSDLTKQRNGLEDKINSLSAQIDTLEKQQD